MMIVAIREMFVLILGCVFSFIGSLMFGNANRDFGALASAILLPIVFCLIRASLATPLESTLSGTRRVSYQLCFSVALVLLLLFEMSFGIFLGAPDIPAAVWVIVAAFGMGYVIFFSVAFRIGSETEKLYTWLVESSVGGHDSNGRENRYADEHISDYASAK